MEAGEKHEQQELKEGVAAPLFLALRNSPPKIIGVFFQMQPLTRLHLFFFAKQQQGIIPRSLGRNGAKKARRAGACPGSIPVTNGKSE